MGEVARRFTIMTVAALSLLAVITIAQQTNTEEASAGTLTVSVDLADTGNAAGTVGSVDNCRVVSVNQTFNIDLVFENGISNLIASELYFQYDPAILEIQSYTILFQNQAGSTIQDGSETLPDVNQPGIFSLIAVETSQLTGDTGLEGVLYRLSVKAIGSGNSPTSLSKIDFDADGVADRGVLLVNSGDVNIGDTSDPDPFFDGPVNNGVVVVGAGSCNPADSDGDGVQDLFDNCPNTPNPSQADFNFDGIGDACQDFDSDGHMDDDDNCPGVANPGQEDLDSDGLGDLCDPDRDGDGVANGVDNCPVNNNPSQSDIDGDGAGDPCDSDMDGDSWPNTTEAAIGTSMSDDCADTTATNDEPDDKWPADFNDDKEVSILDVLWFKPVFFSTVGDGVYTVRGDISPLSGPNGAIDIIDVLALKPVFFATCT